MSGATQGSPQGVQNKGPAFVVVALIFTITASIVTCLRIYIRIRIKHTFGWDDGLIIFSLVKYRQAFILVHKLTCEAPRDRLNGL